MAGVSARAGRGGRGERGFALVFSALVGILSMGIWVLSYRATLDAVRVERFHLVRERRAASVTRALAEGVSLLRTGRPPSDPYACVVTTDAGFDCRVTYTSLVGDTVWDVDAELATPTDIATLPTMPASF